MLTKDTEQPREGKNGPTICHRAGFYRKLVSLLKQIHTLGGKKKKVIGCLNSAITWQSF